MNIKNLCVCIILMSVCPLSSISQDDDFVFEDFARLRLKGVVDDKDEDC